MEEPTLVFTLDEGTVERLPEVIASGYAQGVADFHLRLGAPFDLEALRAPLAEALDRAIALPGVTVALPEIPRCLVAPRHLAFVLSEEQGASRAAAPSPRYTLALLEEAKGGGEPCRRCDLAASCPRMPAPFRARFSGALAPVEVRGRVLRWEQAARELSEVMRLRWVKGTTLRLLPMAELGAHLSLEGGGEGILSRLREALPAKDWVRVAFLEKARCLFADLFVAVFVGHAPLPATRRSVPFWVVLFDDRYVAQPQVEALLSAAARRVRMRTEN